MKTLTLTYSLILVLMLAGCASPDRQPVEPPLETRQEKDTVQLSPEAEQNTDIERVRVSSRAAQGDIKTLAEVKADENKLFHIHSFVSGRVIQDNVVLGSYVRQGQTLAVVQNLDVVKIQAASIHELHANEVAIQKARTQLALAQKNLEREKRLLQQGISPRKDYLQAEADATIARSELAGYQEHRTHIQSEARSLLGAYGMRFNPNTERLNASSPITARRSGIVIKKTVTQGDVVTPEQVLYEVADLNQVWLDVTVYPGDLPLVQVGHAIRFTSDSVPGRVFTGQINYIPPATNEASQTFVARAYLANPDTLLKPGMRGQASILRAAGEVRPFVPEAAVQTYGKESFVFLVEGKGRYKKQTVQLGEQLADGYQIKQGLKAGDVVVGKGSFTLKAEMLKSQFGEE